MNASERKESCTRAKELLSPQKLSRFLMFKIPARSLVELSLSFRGQSPFFGITRYPKGPMYGRKPE